MPTAECPPYLPGVQLPDYWLRRPPEVPGMATAFDDLLASIRRGTGGDPIRYDLPAPKWQFLSDACAVGGLVLHGSPNPAITRFEPRKPLDPGEFSGQEAVFAASDGLWAMFFAVIDRTGIVVTNACIRLVDPSGVEAEPRYFFAISRHALPLRPWRRGSVYLLPGDTFIQQDPLTFGEFTVRIAQWASPVPVVPYGRLEVGPEDFPFVDQVRGHSDDRVAEYGVALATGAPLPE